MRLRVAVLLLLGLLAACGGGEEKGRSPPEGTVSVVIGRGEGRLQVIAEVAATVEQRTMGLMNRTSLPSGRGMLFVFRGPVRGSFHMKNTLIPLDIAFIRAGRVIEIFSMTPCVAEPCPLTRPSGTFEMALEVNAGTFQSAGINAGATVQVRGVLPSPE